jgi:hypothetical protein
MDRMSNRTLNSPGKPLPHPPFHPGPALVEHNTLTHDGAQRLADKIRDVWARYGHDVRPVVEQISGNSGKGAATRVEAMFVVRLPTLHNGLPMRKAGQ